MMKMKAEMSYYKREKHGELDLKFDPNLIVKSVDNHPRLIEIVLGEFNVILSADKLEQAIRRVKDL